MSDAELLAIDAALGRALGRRPGESMDMAARRQLDQEGRSLERASARRAARELLFGSSLDPWVRMDRALRVFRAAKALARPHFARCAACRNLAIDGDLCARHAAKVLRDEAEGAARLRAERSDVA